MLHAAEGFTFEQLKVEFDAIPNQKLGLAGPVCETGGRYVEFIVAMLARPDDVAVIECLAARAMLRNVTQYFDDRRGTIHWRIPLEWVIGPMEVVTRYDENGPDTDFVTDKKCFTDKNWVGVRGYCRVFKVDAADAVNTVKEMA